jgi:hypothetical protein
MGHVAHTREWRDAYGILVGKPNRERSLGRPRCRWEEQIKMELQEVGWGGMGWSNLAQERDVWWAVVITNLFQSTVR